ncbi:menaquinol-cytochrome C reductase [Prauserella marina]|uniref:Cytochrome bc1 complex cytochrome b subunit n=1 Tax=Prauserella marina TaxID=530584 RepID=A0A222VMH3_9PSEU|nr:cytochrome bc complex cytochrome b subunit [Prauserella marina]ASR34921.1 menaquinol-cytochrome C reductase [Prauserella marina]PWV85371.1 menaquinol-cytochrome c reductase cytochrome b subunit precursor [Prauserella marina]SDC56391.1 ubiquinol-cytochrome c reductase cytochrome b subunit [Prauserella marina]
MSSLTTPTKGASALEKHAAGAANNADQRYMLAKGLRHQMNKVFPTHWSFLLGELALYSFIILIVSGVYLTLFFDPSMEEVVYNGPFTNLQGIEMSRAFESTLEISFEVRGGLFVRQVHHWAALIFVASMFVHMFRVFFTGAFRRPREANWVIGALLLILGMFEGFFGYSLPDDLLSGTGIRATLSGIVLSVPVAGTWLHWALFGGEFPGTVIVPRMYALHILLIPGIMLALVAVHLALVWYQKHTQFPGVRRKETNVVGVRIMPVFAIKAGVWFAVVTGFTALMSGLFQINAVWNLGPYNPSQVSAGVQPDWYLAWADGILRIWPAWELYIGNYTVPPVFFAGAIGMGILFTVLIAYPFIERKLTKDTAHHNLLQRPRDAPVRTSLGVMAITFFMVIEASGFNDIIAYTFDISLNAMTWAGRMGVLLLPPLAYWVTYRICLGLQRSDREVLEHGVETGIIKRLPHGEFIEVHQPLGPVDDHGHPVPLEYQGAAVPKKMNQLGSAGAPVAGSMLTPDPAEETRALEAAKNHGHGNGSSAEAESDGEGSREEATSGSSSAPSSTEH